MLDSADACVARVSHRVRLGGHHVPTEDVVRRYRRSLDNFWNRYRFVVDRWDLPWNNGQQYLAVASGAADNYHVENEAAFTTFLQAVDSSR